MDFRFCLECGHGVGEVPAIHKKKRRRAALSVVGSLGAVLAVALLYRLLIWPAIIIPQTARAVHTPAPSRTPTQRLFPSSTAVQDLASPRPATATSASLPASATATSPSLPVVGPQKGTLELVNNTGATICTLSIMGPGLPLSDWALNPPLPNGARRTFQVDVPREYTIRVYGCIPVENLYHSSQVTITSRGHTINLQPLVLDLKISDLYVDNLPVGYLWLRLTHMGHARGIYAWAEVECDLTLTPLPGVYASANPIHRRFPYFVSPYNPVETLPFNTGISLDTNSFTYHAICMIVEIAPGFSDPIHHNDGWAEHFP